MFDWGVARGAPGGFFLYFLFFSFLFLLISRILSLRPGRGAQRSGGEA